MSLSFKKAQYNVHKLEYYCEQPTEKFTDIEEGFDKEDLINCAKPCNEYDVITKALPKEVSQCRKTQEMDTLDFSSHSVSC